MEGNNFRLIDSEVVKYNLMHLKQLVFKGIGCCSV